MYTKCLVDQIYGTKSITKSFGNVKAGGEWVVNSFKKLLDDCLTGITLVGGFFLIVDRKKVDGKKFTVV